jgi:ABC-type nickel/cobalt efflux system permease component RcnA
MTPVAFVAQALKAVFAALVAGLGALQVTLVGGESISQVTAAQWVTIASTALIAFGGVYGIANKPPGDQGEQAAAPSPEVTAK